MPNLRCSVESCGYHRADYCSAGRISVNGTHAYTSAITSCNTYTHGSATNSSDLEPTPEMSVQCDAIKCEYNANHVCSASNIQISNQSYACESSDDTLCASFTPRQ